MKNYRSEMEFYEMLRQERDPVHAGGLPESSSQSSATLEVLDSE